MSVATSECNLIFAVGASGALVSVADVPRGAACGCTCPGCGAGLVAAQGDILAWHFRHEADADCATGYETMAHLLAKEIISHSKLLKLPALVARAGHRQKMIAPERFGRLGKAVQEPWMGGVRPDVIVAVDGEQIVVEVLVTHATGREKVGVFELNAMPAIEIDLSAFRHGLEEKSFREAVLVTAPRFWLHNEALAPVLAEFEEEERQEIARQEAARVERERKRERMAEQEREYQRLWAEKLKQRRAETEAQGEAWTTDSAPVARYSTDLSAAEWTVSLTTFQWLDRLHAAAYRALQDVTAAAKWMRTANPALGNLPPMEAGATATGFRKCLEALTP